jgi:hypothetical protein
MAVRLVESAADQERYGGRSRHSRQHMDARGMPDAGTACERADGHLASRPERQPARVAGKVPEQGLSQEDLLAEDLQASPVVVYGLNDPDHGMLDTHALRDAAPVLGTGLHKHSVPASEAAALYRSPVAPIVGSGQKKVFGPIHENTAEPLDNANRRNARATDAPAWAPGPSRASLDPGKPS